MASAKPTYGWCGNRVRGDALVGTVHGSLFVEEKGTNEDKITAWLGFATIKTDVNGSMARGASRYCMKDAGLYGAMFRSHTVWKKRQDDKELHWRFVERRVVPEVGGRDCFVIERTCPSPEVDPFEIGGEPNIGGKKPEDVGSVRVRLFIDVERWMQVGSELHRAGRQSARLLLLPRHQPESHLRGRHLYRRWAQEGRRGGEEVGSKVAKVANFWGSGVGNLAGQKLYSKVAKHRGRNRVPPTIEVRFRPGFPAFRYGGGYHSRNINRDILFRHFWAEKPPPISAKPTKVESPIDQSNWQVLWRGIDRSL